MATTNEGGNMQERLNFLIEILQSTEDCEVAETAIDNGMEILYGGMRPLPTQGEMLEPTLAAHELICDAEARFAAALKQFALNGNCIEQRGRALDLGLFIDQISEVARAVGQVTAECGEGDSFQEPPCDELQPILDEMTGHEIPVGTTQGIVKRSYFVKLRGPRVWPWQRCLEEDVLMTKPIPPHHCVVVFKEFRGLMIRLHFERIIIVSDPWVATFGVPRGTRLPVWRLEWIFAEYVKQFNICNTGKIKKPKITTTVTQRVKQDHPLNYFWRNYSRKC